MTRSPQVNLTLYLRPSCQGSLAHFLGILTSVNFLCRDLTMVRLLAWLLPADRQ